LALVALALADVFLKVMYARGGWGLVRIGRPTWWAFNGVSRLLPKRSRRQFMSFCGPTLLVVVVVVWMGTLVLGFALVAWPNLGTGIRSNAGPTGTDFWTAVYFAGDTLTTVGSADLTPQTPPLKLLMMFASLVGLGVITMTLAYFVEVYGALLNRNTFALKMHHLTAGTGDAAVFVAGLGAGGDLDHARSDLMTIGDELLQLYESYHFYPVLQYFHFKDTEYVLARVTVVVMDAASLMKTALDPERYGPFQQSAGMTLFWQGAMRLLIDLSRLILHTEKGEEIRRPPPETEECWRRRFLAGLAILQKAGIRTAVDEAAAARDYVALRREWDPYVAAFSRYMLLTDEDADPAGANA
jgi:hypothetical protein